MHDLILLSLPKMHLHCRYGDCLGASGWESVLEMIVVLYRCGALPGSFCAALAGDGEGGLVSAIIINGKNKRGVGSLCWR